MSHEFGGRPGLWVRLIRSLYPGELGAEVVDDLVTERARIRSGKGALAAGIWAARLLVSPSTWILARALRDRGRRAGVRGRSLERGWGFLADARHSARAVLRRPGFALLSVATLAVGIGAVTAVFSLAEAMVLRGLPLEGSERLVRVFSTNPERGLGWFSVSYPDFQAFSDRTDLFEATTFYAPRSADVSGGGGPERVSVTAVHVDFFSTLGTPPSAGRVFDSGDHDSGAPPTAVLSEDFWVGRFGGAPDVVGGEIRIDGVPHTVVGIVEDGAAWPFGTDVWTPLQWGGVVPPFAADRSNHSWQMIGRVADGVDISEASDQVQAMSRLIYQGSDIDPRDRGTGALAVSLASSEAGDGAGNLFVMLGAAVTFVLLLACMNASGLLATRARGRSRELSLRAALGAGRLRLAGILFAESATLAGLAAVVGVLLAHIGLREALRMTPPEIANLARVEVNGTVLAAAVAVTVVATILAGFLPALSAARTSLAGTLKEGGAATGAGRGATRLRRGMVVAELALALTLLVSAGLVVRGLQRQLDADPGFESTELLSFSVRLPTARYDTDTSIDQYYEEAVDRLEALPGVTAAASTSRLPMGAGGMSLGRSFIFDGAVPPPDGPEYYGAWVEVDPSFFETLGVSAVEGRVVGSEDRGDGVLVAVVSEAMARAMSPDASIVGREIRSVYDENLPRTVVGVVPDVQYNGVWREQPIPLVFVPREQSRRTAMSFLVRVAGDPDTAIPSVREALTELDPDVALASIQPLRDAHATDLGGIRFLTTLIGSLGVLALLLAVSGVYGVVSHSVSQRTSEFGLRMAVGAAPTRILASVVTENTGLIVAGLTIGAGLAFAAGRVLESGMDGIARIEMSTYVAVGGLLAVSVLVASLIPAMRATQVDPVRALKTE